MNITKKIKIFHIVIILACGIIFMTKGTPLYGDDYVKVWDSGGTIPDRVFDAAVGDTDDDGKPEIIVSTNPTSRNAAVYVFENDGDDSYQLVWDSGTMMTMSLCYIETGDQDRDGKMEIIAVESGTVPPFNGRVHVYENNGDNSYQEVWNNGNDFSGIEPTALFLGDSDNDGKHEIIVGTGYHCGDRKIYVYENTGDDDYQEVWNSGNTLSDTVMEGAVGDTDGDGKKEIIVGSGGIDPQVHVFENTGDNSYQLVWDSGGTFSRPVFASIGDQDADGKMEIIAAGRKNHIIHIFENTGDNAYTDVWHSSIFDGHVSLVVTGDQDHDGNREIIIPCEGGKIYVFENQGDNNYQEVWNSGSIMNGFILRAAVGDQDRDGRLEIIATSYEEKKVYVFENPGPAAITVEIDIKPGSWPNAINPRRKGVIPVAILTTGTAVGESVDFDATSVDPLSVKFGPGEAEEAHTKGHIKDVDNDGDLDMVLHFKTQETGIQYGDTEVCLRGNTCDGKSIQACDTIKTVSKEKK
ncbi:MAG: VCBS repeat-containing protein [Candidatus Aminicenantes bacterium]|jgi:hypothetical protein